MNGAWPSRWRLACAALILTVVGVGIGQWKRALEPLQIFGVVPDFTLVDSSGRTVTRADFLDKLSVVNFIYTRCTDACPLESAQMALLQAGYAGRPALQLVSITVDPAHDDRRALAAYAERFRADPDRWLFLTGPRDVIYRLAVDVFRLAAVAALRPEAPAWSRLLRPEEAFAHAGARGSERIELAHGSHFAVVDRQARIIGYFNSVDTAQVDRLRATLDRLLPRAPSGSW